MLDRKEAGDTLVEILIATAILGMAIVGALTAMSFGQGIALNATERTSVQGLMNSQLSYLRYARDMKIQNKSDPLWTAILGKATTTDIPSIICNGTRPYSRDNSMFYIQEFTTSPVVAQQLQAYPVVSGVPQAATGFPTPGNGIWIEAKSGGTTPTAYIDFYVKACWSPAGGTTMQESRTVMRLYVPA